MMRSPHVSRCDPVVLDFVTWAVIKGCRLFGRVRVDGAMGLVATERIPEYDFVCLTPATATQSLVTVVEDVKFPTMCSSSNFGEPLPFAPDLTRGGLTLVSYLAATLLRKDPPGLNNYLRLLLPEANLPMEQRARRIAASPDFCRWIEPVRRYARCEPQHFTDAIAMAYSLFRRHAMPLWSSASLSSLPHFQESSFSTGRGDLVGLVPVVDLARHSTQPNAAAGYPDREMLLWAQQAGRIQSIPSGGCVVLQALRDIYPGEVVCVNKNMQFNLEPKAFEEWFGYSYQAEGPLDTNHTTEDFSAAAFLDPMFMEPPESGE